MPTKPTKITRDGDSVRVYYGTQWLAFRFVPGTNRLCCGHTAVGIAVDQYATDAREAIETRS